MGSITAYKNIAFIGDSITHTGLFVRNLLYYLSSRFPENELNFINCGISGDNAGGCLTRYSFDIENHSIDLAVINFGMNDLCRSLYISPEPSAEELGKREAAKKSFEKNYYSLCTNLKVKGVKEFIFCVPTIFDETCKNATPTCYGYNKALANTKTFLQSLTKEFGGSVVDFNESMLKANEQIQMDNPKVSVLAPDRVHPESFGSVLMLDAFINECSLKTNLFSIKAEYTELLKDKKIKLSAQIPCKKLIQFPFKCDYSIYDEILKTLNESWVQISKLPFEKYKLFINNQVVGSYSKKELDNGIKVSSYPALKNEFSKQYQLCENWRAIISTLRNIAYIRYKLNIEKIKFEDTASIGNYLDKLRQESDYSAFLVDEYYKNIENEECLINSAKAVLKDIYSAEDEFFEVLLELVPIN